MAYHRQHFTKYGGIHVRISGKGRRRPQLSPGTALRLGSYAARFLLAAVLAGAEILGGHALFGLALVAVSGSGGEGAAALLGAAMGYLSLRGPVEGLRYIAASMMIYAVSLAFSEYRVLQSRWFMPAAACAISGAVGFVYQSAAGWDTAARAAFLTETVLTAGVVYLFRQGLEVWSTRRTGDNLTPQQAAGLFAMAAAAFLSLARVDVGGCSVGRTAAYAAVALCAWKWGAGVGAAAGVSLGIAMDLAVGRWADIPRCLPSRGCWRASFPGSGGSGAHPPLPPRRPRRRSGPPICCSPPPPFGRCWPGRCCFSFCQSGFWSGWSP